MANFYRNVILGTAAAFMLVIMAGYAITDAEEPPMTYTSVSADGSLKADVGERTQNFALSPERAYANDVSFVDSVRAWFGVDIEAERRAEHLKAEMRKLKLRGKGHRTFNTRTKGVLYNGS